MNVSGILVVVSAERLASAIEALNRLDGVDVHQYDAQTGRIVVTQEAEGIQAEVDGLKRIKALPHVILAEMVYHCFEDDSELMEAVPRELDEPVGVCEVLPYLNK